LYTLNCCESALAGGGGGGGGGRAAAAAAGTAVVAVVGVGVGVGVDDSVLGDASSGFGAVDARVGGDNVLLLPVKDIGSDSD
jgi:hypothetical protein